jgi:hypothetical protein
MGFQPRYQWRFFISRLACCKISGNTDAVLSDDCVNSDSNARDNKSAHAISSWCVMNDALLWNAPLLPRKPRPAEHVWTMRKDGKYYDAKLLGQGEYGWECRFYYCGHFFKSRRWTTKREALSEAEESRMELEGEGWLVCS